MKQYLKPNPINLSVLSLFIIALTIIYSCRKERSENTRPVPVTTDPLVSLAKKWYDSTYVSTSTSNNKQATQSGKKYLHDWSKKFAPYWSRAKIFTEDGTTFIELPAVKNGDMALLFDHTKDTVNYDFSRSGTMTDLLIIKQQGSFAMYAMTIQADSVYLKGDYSRVYNNSYQKMDTNFTGAVLFHQMDGTFVNGYRYLDGHVSRQLSLAAPDNSTIQNNKLKVNVTQPIPPGCGAIIVVTLWLDCSSDGCYTYTTTDIYADCSYQGYSSGSGGSGSSSGGGTTPTPPCVPPPATIPPGGGTHPPAEAFAKGKLLINVAAPPDGGGTTTPAPQPQPCPTTTTTYEAIDLSPVKPCALKFKKITSNWMAVAVKDYKFGIQDKVFGTKFITFNVQIGMPSYVSVQQAQNATAAAMQVAEATIAQTHGVDFFLSASAQVTYSKEFASLVQAQLITELELPGVQVQNAITPGVPIITYADNNCDN